MGKFAGVFLEVLKLGTPSANPFLHHLHNLALGLGWLPWPVPSKNRWPEPQWREKRSILLEEHNALVLGLSKYQDVCGSHNSLACEGAQSGDR